MNLYPNLLLNKVEEITLDILKKNKINALILDVDNTLIDYKKNLSNNVVEWAKNLKANGIKLYILSNTNHEEKVKNVANKLQISYINFAKKPFKKGFLKPLAFLVPPIGILFFVQNHLSVSLVVGVVVIMIMFMAGCRLKHFAVVGIVGISLLVGIFGILQISGSNSFRLDRISTYFDPWADAQGTGYQTVQSLYAIGSGGMFGLGLGNSKQKYLYIPEPHNDFIFSILAEELGFVGCIVVIALFMIFIWRGILIAMRTTDMFGSLIAVGITTLIAFQAIINISVVTATVPTTGMSLPFFSYGGTALLLLLANVGILLNISRSNSKV